MKRSRALFPNGLLALCELFKRTMFYQRCNAITGKMEWESREENYDYHQEVARSAYADMLHDTERNQKYFYGLKAAFEQLRANGRPVKVLDIGTGTGLLSMMSAKLGANEITACEAFAPIAKCAREVITLNGYANTIRLIPKRSTDIVIGTNGDMPNRANVLVTEVFDTELIGEAAIETFNHAHSQLLEEDCLVVPSRATVFIQLVQSDLIRQWHRPLPIKIEGMPSILPPDDVVLCKGSANVLDLQMSQLPSKNFQLLTNVQSIAKFDFSSKIAIPKKDYCLKEIVAIASGTCHSVFFWWDLEMDHLGKVILSCAPNWIHKDGQLQPWRDHWMQAIYFPLNEVCCEKHDQLFVQLARDEFSFWFDVSSRISTETYVHDCKTPRPQCSCGIHSICNYARLGTLNDLQRNRKYEDVLQKGDRKYLSWSAITLDAVCLYIGETSLIPLMAVRLGARKVYILDGHPHSARMLRSYVIKNKMDRQIVIIEKQVIDVSLKDFNGESIDVVLGEPYFTSSLLPWHNLHYWYAVSTIRKLLQYNVTIVPATGKLWAVAVHFRDLWKIRAPLGYVENFDVEPFDKLIQGAIDVADATVEPHALWEYESKALSNPFQLLSFDMSSYPELDLTRKDSIPLLNFDSCNGIALWMEWHLNDTTVICQGPVSPIVPGERIEWDVNSKQGVHFMTNGLPSKITSQTINCGAHFDVSSGNVKFEFILE